MGKMRCGDTVHRHWSVFHVTHLFLIRHAEAISNVEPIIAGMRGDTGLTLRGLAQAERLRDRLATTGEMAADVLIASTLPRARQTAEIIAPALGLPIVWDDDLQEIRVGEADGMRVEEFFAAFGEPNFERDPYHPIAPGGESWAQFQVRVGTTLSRIAREQDGKTVVAVTHGGIVDGAFMCFFGVSLFALRQVSFHTHNTSITHWEQIMRDDQSVRWRLGRYNDAAHLDTTPQDSTAMQATQQEGHPSAPLPTEDPAEGAEPPHETNSAGQE
jgi:probable phosphoglycerate mutase